jgi:hypothetical protein
VTKIAALNVQTSHRPTTAPAAAHGSAKGHEAPAEVRKTEPAQPAVSAHNTPAPAAPLVAPGLMGALIDLQAHVEAAAPKAEAVEQFMDKAAQGLQSLIEHLGEFHHEDDHSQGDHGHGDHGARSGHPGHVDNGQGGHHTDRGHHGKPPSSQPEPQPAPAPVVIPSFDPGMPARAIAQVNETLAQGRASEQARTAFVTAAVQRRSATYVAQGQAALAIFQQMQSQFAAWQADGATGQRGLYV